MLEGTLGDKKRVVLASSDEFNSLSFVQVIGKQTFMNEPLEFKQHCCLIKTLFGLPWGRAGASCWSAMAIKGMEGRGGDRGASQV